MFQSAASLGHNRYSSNPPNYLEHQLNSLRSIQPHAYHLADAGGAQGYLTPDQGTHYSWVGKNLLQAIWLTHRG